MENWQTFLDSTVQKCQKSKFYEAFSKASNNEERCGLVIAENLLNVDWINHYLDEIQLNQLPESLKKRESTANKYRQDGNAEFQRARDKDALEAYNKCVLFAPWPTAEQKDETLAMGLANRSAVLFRMKRYKECLVDIDLALSKNYPDRLVHKVLLRKAKCYYELGLKENASQCVGLLTDHIESNAELEETQKVNARKETRVLVAKIEAMKTCSKEDEPDNGISTTVPSLSYGAGAQLTNASSAISLTWSKDKGRHFMATREIEPGDTLIRERPYGGVLLPAYYDSRCHHCYSLVTIVYPCDECARVKFCSIPCQQEAMKKYHRVECRYLLLLHCIGVAHLSLRIILNAGLDFLLDFHRKRLTTAHSRDDSTDTLKDGLDADGVYDTSYNAVYSLVTHESDMDTDDILQYTLTSVLLLRCLQEAGYFATHSTLFEDGNINMSHNKSAAGEVVGSKSSDSGVIICSLLLRHICQIICNAHAITELQASQVDAKALVNAQNQVRIATALYPTSSLCNHSCRPSFINSFHKDVLIVRAVKKILPGEEVYNCYGPQARRMARGERQRVLREQYFFSCKCVACEEEEYIELKHQAVKCTDCDGAIRLTSESEGLCTDCDKMVNDVAKTRTQADVAREKFIQGIVLLDQGDVAGAIRALGQCLKSQKKILYRFNRDLSETNDALARCYASLGNFAKSAEHLKVSITTTEEIFGKKSIEMANELQKYSDILIQCYKVEDASKAAKQALDIFSTHYGPHHQSVQELTEFLGAIKMG